MTKKRISNKGDFVMEKGRLLFHRVGPIKAIKQKDRLEENEDDELVRVKNTRSPEKRGLWAFPYPIFDHWFVPGKWSGQSDNDNKTSLTPQLIRQINKRKKGLVRRIEQLTAGMNAFDELTEVKERYKYKWEIDEIQWMVDELQRALDEGEIVKRALNGQKICQKPVKTQKFWWGGPIYAHFAPKGLQALINDEWYRYENAQDYLIQLRKHLIDIYKDSWGDKEFGPFKCIVKGIGHGNGGGLAADHLEVFIPYRG